MELKRLATFALIGMALAFGKLLRPVFGYQISFKSVKGQTFKPVPVKKVHVYAEKSYVPRVGDQNVGLLILSFESHELGHDAQALKEVAAEEAAAVGANAAYQQSVTFDKSTDEISGATFQCFRAIGGLRGKL
jgi:hypothetical protein